jgi:hypothetical protein
MGTSGHDGSVTISALATATGTLVLAVATFASVRSANRAARVAEQAFLIGQRAIGLFTVAPGEGHQWICSVVKHWDLDRPNLR